MHNKSFIATVPCSLQAMDGYIQRTPTLRTKGSKSLWIVAFELFASRPPLAAFACPLGTGRECSEGHILSCFEASPVCFVSQHLDKPTDEHVKGQKMWKQFFQADISSKTQTNEFYFTTMKPQVDLFLLVFWRKLKTPKRHFEIIWPLVMAILRDIFFN